MTSNRLWVLARRPVGNDYAAAFDLTQETLPALAEGQVLIRNRVLSMDTGTRMWFTDREDSYSPPLALGDRIIGTVLGEVVDSRHSEHRIGDRVRCYGSWSDYSVVTPGAAYIATLDDVNPDLKDYVGIVGANGWTAYIGVIETGDVCAGDTFVVSAAAGCTGLMAGQIAKIAGCRVIGIAGSDAKCRLIQSDYGFDGAINYKTENVEAALAKLCPEGVNVYFDNVGGPILDAVLPNMALYGRVAVCGLITNYIATEPVPGPYHFDQVLMKRLKIEGFFSPDFYRREAELSPILRRWAASGQLKLPFDASTGLENTIAAYTKLFTGENVGKVVVEL
jgi:NADPH-dependent curcumin reductase CurA